MKSFNNKYGITSAMDRITQEKITKYLKTTEKALDHLGVAKKKDFDWNAKAMEVLDMAKRYHRDAGFYMKKGDYVTAFAACNYAHGWIDAGVRLGLFDAPPGTEEFIMPSE